MTDVYIEQGSKRVFACAVEWPGWCRSGKTEEAALEALAASAERYAVVAKQARIAFETTSAKTFVIKEKVRGTATTDFGAPDAVSAADRAPFSAGQSVRASALVEAAWVVFDRVVAKAPASLRKGPRGGGRDRDQVAEHVLGAEDMYARKLGLRIPEYRQRRVAILEVIRSRPANLPEKGWPLPYAARRIAWHAIDHAWEIEDRSEKK
jgi:hypothetical protein